MRFRRALDLEDRIAAGDQPATEDLLWLGGYQTGPEYRAMRKVHQDFGDEMSL
jgi:putative transposase